MMREVASGMQKLVALALPGQPPAETIALTAAAWCEAMETTSIRWDESLDAARLRSAFSALMRAADRWPQPVHLMRALPARPEPPKLSAPKMTQEERQRARAILAGIADQMRGNR